MSLGARVFSNVCAVVVVGGAFLPSLVYRSIAMAAGPVNKKTSTILPTVKPEAPKTSSESVDLKKIKPPKMDAFTGSRMGDDRLKLEAIVDQQIQELYKLTQNTRASSSYRGEFWLRLGELYVEKAGLVVFRKQNEYQEKMKLFGQGKIKVRPSYDENEAREHNEKAVQLYERFVRDFPKDNKMDQALFFLGYNYFELGQPQKGLSRYARLIREYPNSPFTVDAHFALAEYSFEEEAWNSALDHYQEVIEKSHQRLYGFSIYKSAWCLYRMGKTRDAMAYMERLIREEQQNRLDNNAANKNKLGPGKEGLRDSLRDTVIFYADGGVAERAPEYFRSLLKSGGDEYIDKLAYVYMDKGEVKNARFLFEYLIKRSPFSPKVFDYRYRMLLPSAVHPESSKYMEELFSWILDFGSTGEWHRANSANKDLMESSFKLREVTLRDWILTQHRTAQNSSSRPNQEKVYEGYKVYIQEFQNGSSIADMRFFFAELLYDMGYFQEAGLQYQWVVDNAPTSKYAAKAVENVILAMEKGMPSDDEIAKAVGKSLERVPFSSKAEKFVRVSVWYIKKFPKTEKAVEVRFRLGRIHYQHNQFDEAVSYFREVLQGSPDSKYTEYSANLLLDIYNLKHDYASLEKVSGELLLIPSILRSKTGAVAREVMEGAQFKMAQNLEIEKKYEESASKFEKFAHQSPKPKLAVAAYFNAAINYERAGLAPKAMLNHEIIISSKDKEAASLKPKSRRILAKLYQDSGRLEEAAKTYQAAAMEFGKEDPLAANFFFNAALLDEALGYNSGAIQNLLFFMERSKSKDRSDALFSLADLYRKEGRWSEAIDKYKEYIDLDLGDEKTVRAIYRLYEHSKQMKDIKGMEHWKKQIFANQRKGNQQKAGVGLAWVAKVQLDEATSVYNRLQSTKVPEDTSKQQKVIQSKIDQLEAINQILTEVVKSDSPEEIVGALNLLGRANRHVGEAFATAPIPSSLKGEEATAYREEIQKLAEPFFSKALESFRVAYERGSQLEVYGEALDYARSAFQQMAPHELPDRGEVPLSVRFDSWMVP